MNTHTIYPHMKNKQYNNVYNEYYYQCITQLLIYARKAVNYQSKIRKMVEKIEKAIFLYKVVLSYIV